MTHTNPFSIGFVKETLRANGYSFCYQGVPELELIGLSDPGQYEIGTAVWLGAMKYLNMPEGMSFADVALVFVSEDFEDKECFDSVLICDDPRNAFMCIAESLVRGGGVGGVSEMATVDPSASIGEDVFIAAGVIIESGVTIGDRTRIFPYSTIKHDVHIGADCLIMDGCVVGNEGFGFRKMQNGSLQRLPHLGSVRIDDSVEIGSRSVIDRGTFRDTIIGQGTKLDSFTLIGHNAQIGEDCLIISGFVGGNCTVGDRCELIHMECKNRINIGNDVRVGLGSVVIKDIPDGCEVFGNPARVIRK